jgi:putative intracellular protease/amidase
MKSLLLSTVSAVLLLAAVGANLTIPPAPVHAATRYVCPPCGSPCDTASFDKPGNCPVCGMALVDASTLVPEPPHKKVAILVFNSVEIIDYTGPWEVFGGAGYDVYTVAETKAPVTTAMGMTVVPNYTFADAPQPDILLVPGGGVRKTQNSQPTLDWIRKTNGQTNLTMSVCNGAFILASAGLLDGLSATTTVHNIEPMRAAFPKVHVVGDQRVVDNGHVITTGGLSAGIDGALHVVSRIDGEGTAQQVALSLEYNWQPKTPFLPAELANRLLPDIDLRKVAQWQVVSTRGDKDEWEFVVRGTTKLAGGQLLDQIDDALASQAKWKSVQAAQAGTSKWSFTDGDGKAWNGVVSVEDVPGKSGQYTTKFHIARAS